MPSAVPEFQNAFVGLLAGLTEVACQHPTVAWKNALQQNRPVPLNPRELYRGLIPNAMAVAPVTAIQFSIFAALGTNFHPLLASALAGGLSAIAATPLEKILVLQQLNKAPLIQTARSSLRSRPFKGFSLTAAREGCYAVGYLGLAPLFSTYLSDDFSEPVRRTLGSLIAGCIAGVTTHPFDTAKTYAQSTCRPMTSAQAISEIVDIHGFSGLFRGLIPRGLRIVGAVIIMQESKVQYEKALFGADPTQQ